MRRSVYVMLEIAPDGQSVTEKFRDQTFDNQNHGVVLVDGFLYGSNFTGRNTGKWLCMNWDALIGYKIKL